MTVRAVTSRITYGGYRNKGKLFQSIKHSRWKSVVITLTVDLGTSKYIIKFYMRKRRTSGQRIPFLSCPLSLLNDSKTNKRES